MRKRWTIALSMLAVLLIALYAATRPRPDDLAPLRPYSIDETTMYHDPSRFEPPLPRPPYMIHSLTISGIDQKALTERLKRICSDQEWGEPEVRYGDNYYFFAFKGELGEPGCIVIMGMTLNAYDPLGREKHSLLVGETRTLSRLDVWKIIVQHSGRNPFLGE